MRVDIRFPLILPLLGVLFFSCGKSSTAGLDSPFLDSKDISAALNLLSEVRDDVILKIQHPKMGNLGHQINGEGNCPKVVFQEPEGTYPNTMVLDYEKECICHYNIIKSGKVVVEKSASLDQEGSEWRIHFEDYVINEVKVEGHQLIIPQGKDESNAHRFKITSEDIRLTWPNGKSIEFKINGELEMVGGIDNEDIEDDVYGFSGEFSGKATSGLPFKASTIEPILKAHNCRWISSGSFEIGQDEEVMIVEFGDSTKCDDRIYITRPNGKGREMDLVFRKKR